jgi:beta-1,4-mannosyl-glycoprotein beta-1,4-N-acetylglucosaminyltransferase
MIKIVDCFTFNNNYNLLNYRLNILNTVVDYFVIVESYTENDFIIEENNFILEKFKEKIIRVKINNELNDEIIKRNSMSIGIDKIKDLNNTDVLIISDLNEIPDPNTLLKIKQGFYKIEINILEMEMYYKTLNNKLSKNCYFAKTISYKNYSEMKLSCNDIRNVQCYIIPRGGWCLSNFNDEIDSKEYITSNS